MSKKRKIVFSTKLEELQKQVAQLENDTCFGTGSVLTAYWAHSLYSEFFDEMGITEPMFPIQLQHLKPFLLELSKVYAWSTVDAVYLNLRRAHCIVDKISLPPAGPEIRDFKKLLRASYKERISGSPDDIKHKRRPLLPRSVYRIIDSLDDTAISLRDKSILLINMVLGQRCDSLQYCKLCHLEFVGKGGNRSVKITIIKEKECFLSEPRIRNITPSEDPQYDPVRVLGKWIWIREAFETSVTDFNIFWDSPEELKLKRTTNDYPLWCTVECGVINNANFLLSRTISARITKIAENAGFPKGSITGHSMRKGTATSWMLRLLENKGSYSREGWFIYFHYTANS